MMAFWNAFVRGLGQLGVAVLVVAMMLALSVVFLGTVAALSGCTATGYDRQAAQAAATKGCYCRADKCESVVSAVGIAATVAAEQESARQVKTTPR